MKKTNKILTMIQVFILFSLVLTAQIPAGYYNNAKDKKKDALKTALHQLAGPLKVYNYGSGTGSTWEGFYHTDQNANGSVIDMYSNIVRYFNGYNSVTDMHIEHSFPKSWWGGVNNNAYKDLFHLYPSDGITNSTKNNNPLGEIYITPSFDNGVSKIGKNGYGGVYTGTCFEPANEYKGDFARSYFYISTIYEELAPSWDSPMLNKNTYPSWTPWALGLLMKWNQQDPVSIKERLRQEEVYKIQGNRNPFIDYPDLVNYIWGADTLSVYPFSSENETFINSPMRGTSLDYGVVLKGDQIEKGIAVQGTNIISALSLTFKKNVAFTVSPSSLSPAQAIAGSNIHVYFNPLKSGIFIDTLVINGGGLSAPFYIPLRGQAAAEMMVLEPATTTPVGAEIKWIADPQALQYKLTINKGSTLAGNLMISAYVEGSSNNKALELYNGTGKTLNLGDYSLQKQSNGAGEFASTFTLSGQLKPDSSYQIVHKFATAGSALKLMADAITDSVLNFNGNDAVALLHHGIMIDMVGTADAGEAVLWGLDKTLLRRPEITHPTLKYSVSEWSSDGIDSIRYLGKHQFQPWLPVTLVNEVNIPVTESSYIINNLEPESSYTCFVESVRSGGNVKSVNSIRFKTAKLDAPVVMDAVDIRSNRFTANWESDLNVNTYLLDVFKASGTADTTINEGFTNVTANGKPLPDGWTGTATGNYTTTTSSGAAIPALALKNAGEYVQTKNFAGPVTHFRFMYRYPSGAGASYFKVDGYNGTAWVKVDSINYVNTSKYYMDYYFNREDNMLAFRITYTSKASTANLALDDFSMTYNNQTITYVLRDQAVTGNEFIVNALNPATEYFYKVRTIKGSSVSDYSETIRVTTSLATDVLTSAEKVQYSSSPEGIRLNGLSGNDHIRVFNFTGKLLYQVVSGNNEVLLPITKQGVYIIAIQHQHYTEALKVIR